MSSSGGRDDRPTGLRLEGNVFYSDVRDLIQTVVLAGHDDADAERGRRRFYGAEFAVDAPTARQL